MPLSHSAKLPPLKFEDEVSEFEARQEKKDISFKRCDHKHKVVWSNGWVKCRCGAGWTGPRSQELYKYLTN
jgi:hypothetical protein